VAENYALGYSLGNSTSVISDCIAIWNSDACAQQTVFSATALPVGGIRAEFYGESANTAFFKDYSFKNALEGCLFNEALEDANKYVGNLKTPVIPLS
jgi:hypothetical protein